MEVLQEILNECKLLREEHRQRSLGIMLLVRMVSQRNDKHVKIMMEVIQNMLATQDELLKLFLTCEKPTI